MVTRTTKRVALVTGGGGALGGAICRRLASAGCVVAVCDADGDAAMRVARQIGRAARPWTVDVANPAGIARLFSAVTRALGAPAILVNCAGRPGRFAPLAELSDADWHAARSVHLDGAFYCLRAAAPPMVAVRFGRIINIASLAGLQGTVGSGAYAAAKAGMIGLTRTAAKELGPFGITVNAIAPGLVASPVNRALHERSSGFVVATLQQTPTRAMSSPDDIAELAGFLASDAARNLTGQVLAHDGGAGITMATDEYMREQTRRTRGDR